MSRRRRFLLLGGVIAVGLVVVMVTTCSIAPTGEDEAELYADNPAFKAPSYSVAAVDRELERLEWGNIAFNAPSAMQFKAPQKVELALSPTLSIGELEEALERRTDIASARLRISNVMEAHLTGTSGFDIKALTQEEQAITTRLSRWRWEVTPVAYGEQSLYLTLSAHIRVEGRDAPHVVRSFDHKINVEITLPQRVSGFFQNNWQWLWATVLVPTFGAALRIRQKRRQAETHA